MILRGHLMVSQFRNNTQTYFLVTLYSYLLCYLQTDNIQLKSVKKWHQNRLYPKQWKILQVGVFQLEKNVHVVMITLLRGQFL